MSWLKGSDTVWINGEPWESSFEECMSAYFDNLALDDHYEKAVKQGNVSVKEAQKAKAFNQLAYAYIEPSEDPAEILEDEEWIEVVTLAKELWDYLKVTVTSQREKNLVKQLEEEFSF